MSAPESGQVGFSPVLDIFGQSVNEKNEFFVAERMWGREEGATLPLAPQFCRSR
jgi:hypothetical protein